MFVGKLSDALRWESSQRFYQDQIRLEELVLIGLNQEKIKKFGYLEVFVCEFYFLSALLIFMCICNYEAGYELLLM